MTFGAINEISTLTGYQALISRTDFAHDRSDSQRPLLTTILERIIKDERRHFAFYFNQARRRLRAPAARRLTALLVRNFWTPVGVTVRGDPAMRRVCAYLFPGDSGVERLAAVDRSIARLPGLEWFDLGARYARRVQASEPRICFPRAGSIQRLVQLVACRLARIFSIRTACSPASTMSRSSLTNSNPRLRVTRARDSRSFAAGNIRSALTTR